MFLLKQILEIGHACFHLKKVPNAIKGVFLLKHLLIRTVAGI